jgi:hypothetical protein
LRLAVSKVAGNTDDARRTGMAAWGERWWGISGIVFVVLFLIGFGAVGNSGDTGAEVLAFFDENRVQTIVAFFVLLASAVAYVWFVAAVRSVLARAEPEPRGLTGLGFGAGLVTATLLIVGAAPLAALSDTAGDAEAGIADAFYLVGSLSYPLLTGGIGVSSLLALAVGIVALRTRVLPRWLGLVSVVAAPFILVAVLFLPIFVFLAWVAVVSVVLLMQPQASAAPAAAAP